MTKKRQAYKSYTKDFKLEAIRLMNKSDKPSSEIAAESGIRRNQLYKWKDQLEAKAANNRGQVFPCRNEIFCLIDEHKIKNRIKIKRVQYF